MNIAEVFKARSQNGRWGLSVVAYEGTTFPAEGQLQSLGTVEGKETYVFIPGPSRSWVLPMNEEAESIGGATVVACMDLQGGSFASLLLLSPLAVVRTWGYKCRSSRIWAFKEGTLLNVPASVLAAQGLIPTPDASPEPIPAPAPLQGALATALLQTLQRSEKV